MQEVSSPARLWRHVVGTRGPRSYNGVTSKIDIDAEVKLEQDSPSEEQGGSETTTSKAEDTTTTRFVSECVLPTPRGSFRLRAYRHEGHGRSLEPVVMVAVSAVLADTPLFCTVTCTVTCIELYTVPSI